jgi:hypothetical protein
METEIHNRIIKFWALDPTLSNKNEVHSPTPYSRRTHFIFILNSTPGGFIYSG